MEYIDIKQLRSVVSRYVKPNNKAALIIFSIDMSIYIACLGGIIFIENILLKILFSVFAGLKMASLFVIAHDAAHDNYTDSKLLNRILARLAFLPCYHNYSLWLIAHNRLHHQLTNIKGVNSWSPLSKQDYEVLPEWRKKLEHLYRTPLGIAINYFVERWWKDKFFPYKRLIKKFQYVAFMDFILVFTYLFSQIMLFTYIGSISLHANVFGMIVLGMVIPFAVFCFMVGFSVYQQHTHETVPWFKTVEERDMYCGVEDVTVHVCYPYWYNLISHNVMEHTAHHVDPRVPLYHLYEAQQAIAKVLGEELITIKFSLKAFFETMHCCKLYDYEHHLWMNFEGESTSAILIQEKETELRHAA